MPISQSLHLSAERMRFLVGMSLYRGCSLSVDELAMQPPEMRPVTAARGISALSGDYPEVLQRSRELLMKDALIGEAKARHGGEVVLLPGFVDANDCVGRHPTLKNNSD